VIGWFSLPERVAGELSVEPSTVLSSRARASSLPTQFVPARLRENEAKSLGVGSCHHQCAVARMLGNQRARYQADTAMPTT